MIDYKELLDDIKRQIHEAQIRAGLAANRELILLYWDIGRTIVTSQRKEGWGKSVVERLSKDLKKEFPALSGFSSRNLWRMRSLYLAYTEEISNLPQPVAEIDGKSLPPLVADIPWGHNIILLEKIKDYNERFWYIRKTIEHGWSRNVLIFYIESELYQRKGKAVTNFIRTLPAPQSDLAQQIIKDPYVFDFLEIADDARERELENALLTHLKKFLLELGAGFAFVGNQVKLEVGDDDYYIDLLFYHLKLRCYVVIDLKTKPFIPEDAGKMNFYLNAVDDLLMHKDDQQSIGLILCKQKGKNRLVLEYALRGMKKPIGISEYKLTRSLPKTLKSSLPTIQEIEAELTDSLKKNDSMH